MTGSCHNSFRAALRLLALICWTICLLLPSLIGKLLLGRAPKRIIRLWHRSVCVLLGLDIEISGEPTATAPALFVANHVSYLDILVLGTVLDTGFIAKSEVGRWPVIGYLARLIRTVFVNRDKRSSSSRQRDAIAERLAAGESLALFAEGTSSDGTEVLPFKSALFGAVEPRDNTHRVTLQPLTLAYASQSDATLAGQKWGANYAWHGDMKLAPHLWHVLGLHGACVRVLLHAPVRPTAGSDRKNLASAAQRVVSDGLFQIHAASRADGVPWLNSAG